MFYKEKDHANFTRGTKSPILPYSCVCWKSLLLLWELKVSYLLKVWDNAQRVQHTGHARNLFHYGSDKVLTYPLELCVRRERAL